MSELERLQKVLSQAGIASRRQCEKLIRDGKIIINNKRVACLGDKIDLDKDIISIEGKKIKLSKHKIYLMLHKPKDTLCTKSDPRNRQTIYNCLPSEIASEVFSVGRLDRQTTGLLLMTNDGDLANTLALPSNHIPKEYIVTINGKLSLDDLQSLENGVQCGSRKTKPAKVKIIEYKSGTTKFSLTITEGMNRQIRRMLLGLGHEVTKLKRISIGSLELGDLQVRSFRVLSPKEIKALKKYEQTPGTKRNQDPS